VLRLILEARPRSTLDQVCRFSLPLSRSPAERKPISSEKLLQPSAASNEALFRPRVAPGFGHDSMSTDRSTTFAEHVDPGDQLQLHVHVDLGSRLLADDTLGTDTCMKMKRVFLVAPTANTRLRDVVSATGFTISHFFRQAQRILRKADKSIKYNYF